MPNIAKLNVLLVANARGFRSGLVGASRDLEKFSKRTAAVGRNIGGGLAHAFKRFAIGAGIAGTAIAHVVNTTRQAIDAQSKMSRRLGFSYKGLKSLQVAAGFAGIETEALNKSFEKMSETIGAANLGESGALAAFEALKLNAEVLGRLRPEAQFRAISNALHDIPDISKRIALARDIFGRQGGAVLELINGGGAALKNAARVVELYGLALSDKNAQRVEAANDSFSRLQMIFEGAATQITSKLSPAIYQIGEDANTWVENMGGIEKVVDEAFPKVISGLDDIAKSMEDTVGPLAKVLKFLRATQQAQTGLKNIVFGQRDIPQPKEGESQGDYINRLLYGDEEDDTGKKGPIASLIERGEESLNRKEKEFKGPGVNPILNPDVFPSPSDYFEPSPGRKNLGPVFTPKYMEKIPSGAAGYESKIPSGSPKYLEKIPDGEPKYMSKMASAGNGSPDPALSLLQQIAHNTGKGRVAYLN